MIIRINYKSKTGVWWRMGNEKRKEEGEEERRRGEG